MRVRNARIRTGVAVKFIVVGIALDADAFGGGEGNSNGDAGVRVHVHIPSPMYFSERLARGKGEKKTHLEVSMYIFAATAVCMVGEVGEAGVSGLEKSTWER